MKKSHAQGREPSSLQRQPVVLTIGRLSHLTGVPIKAIRYYEQIGLLPAPARESNGYRQYTQADVYRVNFLRRLRFLGTPLTEARPLVDATKAAPCHLIQTKLLQLIKARLAELDREITVLTELRQQVQEWETLLASRSTTNTDTFAACFDGACLACSRLRPEEEQAQSVRCKEQGFYENRHLPCGETFKGKEEI